MTPPAIANCARSLPFSESPFDPRSPSFIASSTNPIAEYSMVTMTAIQISGLRGSAQSSVVMTTATMMRIPPIVGVFFLAW